MSSATTTDYSEAAMLDKVLASNTNEDAIDTFVSSTAAQDTDVSEIPSVATVVADNTDNKDDPPSSNKEDNEVNEPQSVPADAAGTTITTTTITPGVVGVPPNVPSFPNSSSYTFPARLQKSLFDQPYNNSMRRSVQTAILYEANRCHQESYNSMKPFQRKIALFETCKDILSTLTFIPVYHRIEVLFRTATGKTPLTPELAWRRMKLIDREIGQQILPKFSELWNRYGSDRSHDYVCDQFLQQEFEVSKGGQTPGKKYGSNWEFTHSNIFLTFRMYYLGPMINPLVPQAVDPNPKREIPTVKPAYMDYTPNVLSNNPRKLPNLNSKSDSLHENPGGGIITTASLNDTQGVALSLANLQQESRKRERDDDDDESSSASVTVLNSPADRPIMATFSVHNNRACGDFAIKRRRALLNEVKEHLDVLKEFHGIIPTKEIQKRRRELYMSLPPAPYSDYL